VNKILTFGTAICAGLCVSLLSACSSTGSAGPGGASGDQATTHSLYDRVTTSGKLRCGYILYSPSCMKDPNTGKLYGIGVEVLEKVAEKLSLEIVWAEEVGWGSMLEGLQTNRYDVIATPVWTNANRAKLVDFSKPLYYSPLLAYVKAGDKRFGNEIAKFDSPKVKVATIDGETAEVIATADFPKAQKVSLPQLTDVSQMLMTVSTGKADVTFTEPALATGFLKMNPNSIEAVKTDNPIRIFPNCWTFSRGQYEFKAMTDTVLEELINSGFVDKLLAKYEPAPGTLYRVAPGYLKPSR